MPTSFRLRLQCEGLIHPSFVSRPTKRAYGLWPIACAKKTGFSLFLLYAISHILLFPTAMPKGSVRLHNAIRLNQ
jgi:hypothetical protein